MRDPEGERLVALDPVRELRDEQRGIVRGGADLTERGAHATIAVLETVVRLEAAVGAVLGEHAQSVVAPVVVPAVVVAAGLATVVTTGLPAVVVPAGLPAVVAAAILAAVVAAAVLRVVGEGALGQLVQSLRALGDPADGRGDPVQRRGPLVGERPQDGVVDEVAVAGAVRREPPVGLGDLAVQQGEVAVHLGARLVGHLRQLAPHVRAGHGRGTGARAAPLGLLALGGRHLPVTPVVAYPPAVLPGPCRAALAVRRGGSRARGHAGRRGGTDGGPPVLGGRDLGDGDDSAEDRERADHGQQTLAPRVTG
ncbi:hypothetical protein [Micromonospora fulviviridis]|uniref:hypothetical protein n=1 Tax=Micromonospora fulviviridis TaxID=47860 RepID=UPI0037AC467A